MRITTKKGRDFAFKLRRIRNDRTGKKQWFVGITTKEYFWLDLNTPFLVTAKILACWLSQRLKTDVYIFETTKSFWLVTKAKLSKEDWDKEYKHWLRCSKTIMCHAFCECCIRYHKATLRVSAKKGKRPRLVKVINRLEGGQGATIPPAPRLRDFSKSQRAEALPQELTLEKNIKTSVSLVGEYGAVSQGLTALNPYGEPNFVTRLPHLDSRDELVNLYRRISPFLLAKCRFFERESARRATVSPFLRPNFGI